MTKTAVQIGSSQDRELTPTYKHPERANPTHRLRRLPADAMAAAERIEERIAELDAAVFRSMALRREANIEVGRALNELKKILGHGKWQRHFTETFGRSGLNLRTAERYMKRASKNDNVSFLKRATDPGAQVITNANEQAQAEVDAAAERNKPKKVPLRLYRLPLHMTSDEKDAVDEMLKLPDWSQVEKKIVSLLRRFGAKYGVVNNDGRGRS